MNYNLQPKSYNLATRGVTLIDTVFGSALMLIVFMGIAAVFQLSVDVVTNNKARAGALALANERLEFVRSLPYSSVGTVGGIPAGTIAQSESVSLNNVSYTRRTVILYVDDPGDGVGAADNNGITIDYKVVKTDASWSSKNGERHITLVSRVSPPSGMEVACPPSAQCGTLVISVLNSATQPVSNALVRIVNASTSPAIDTTLLTNPDGIVNVVGAPVATGYSVIASKSGYSTDQTYVATAQNTNPTPGPFTVANNQTTSGTFRIDLLSSLTIHTYEKTNGLWQDVFSDETKLDAFSNVEISDGAVELSGGVPYLASGTARSVAVSPTAILRWGAFSWTDATSPSTDIQYRIYYFDNDTPTLLPDSVLAGNSSGFTSGTSVDLSAVLANAYPSLAAEATLSTSDTSVTPTLSDWTFAYENGEALSATISLRGNKTIGSGASGILYKYNVSSTSTAPSGSISLPTMEWDTYTPALVSPTGRTLSSACPSQPLYLAPNIALSSNLYFSPSTAHSLLIDIKSSSGQTLTGASVQLTRTGHDETLGADACGHTFFSSLSAAEYSISVTYPGYLSHVSDVNISGATSLSIVLNAL